jgi:DNA-binding cell septation regulator SpoVG
MALDPNSNAALEVTDQANYMNIVKTAPIMELVEFTGVSLDEAVQMRVNALLETAPPKMDITVRPIEPQGNLYGFASVTVGGIRIDDFKIVQNKDGALFVGMPSKPDKNSTTGYRNTVFVDKDMREGFTEAVVGAYHVAVEHAQDHAAKLKATPEKQPERIADQVAKAQKQADKANAALAPKEKGTKKREEARE